MSEFTVTSRILQGTESRLRAIMRAMILLLLPLWFMSGLLGGPALREFASPLCLILTLGILFRWVHQDSSKRKAGFSWPLRMALLFLTAIALPYYFFKSRGWMGGLKLTAQAWGIFIASMLCYRIGYAL